MFEVTNSFENLMKFKWLIFKVQYLSLWIQGKKQKTKKKKKKKTRTKKFSFSASFVSSFGVICCLIWNDIVSMAEN